MSVIIVYGDGDGWLARWQLRTFFLWVLGYGACHLGVTVRCPQCRAGSGSESSSQALTAHHCSGF